MRKMILTAILAAGVGGCATTSTGEAHARPAYADKNIDKLATQASFDLQCSPSEMQIVQLSSEGFVKTFGVRGCGRQGTYKLLCSLFGQCSVLTEGQAHLMASP